MRCQVLFVFSSFVCVALAKISPTYRLPNSSIPIRYDLKINTDIHRGQFNFSGRVKIHIKIVTATRVITLHRRFINIERIDLLDKYCNVMDPALSFDSSDNVYDFLRIFLPTQMPAKRVIILDISYNGELRDNNYGFHRQNYTNAEGEIVHYAVTHFEPTHARLALPCYDEPDFRAVFRVKIEHHKSYDALLNTLMVEREETQGSDYVTSRFDATPSIPVYLLAFVISNFKCISNNETETEQRICAKPQSIESGDVNYAVKILDSILYSFEELFEVPYPLKKFDHVSVARMPVSGMENIGLAIYPETSLLVSDAGSYIQHKRVGLIITHEIAHQWFGNMVTPKYWQFLWLKEGLAVFYSLYMQNELWPEDGYINYVDRTEIDDVDLLAKKSKPMNYYNETSKGITQKYDFISYTKAGGVFRMFHEALTEPIFTQGIRYFLKKMRYKSATPEDLYRKLQKAYDEDFPRKKLDIGSLMSTWTTQSGFPIIKVQRTRFRFVLTQTRFGGGDEIYAIPISYTTTSKSNFEDTSAKLWLTTKSAEVYRRSNDSWIILNINATAIYKVKYDEDIWKAIISSLKNNLDSVGPVNREQLFAELNTLLKIDEIDVCIGLELIDAIKSEHEYHVWSKAISTIELYLKHLMTTEILSKYQSFINSVLTQSLTKLGFEEKDEEPNNEALMRIFLKSLSCDIDDKKVLNIQHKRLVDALETGDIESFKYESCDGLKLANKSVHEKVFDAIENADYLIRKDFIYHLGCSLKPKFIKRYLRLMLNATNDYKGAERAAIPEMPLKHSAIGLNTTFHFIADNFNQIREIIPDNFKALLTLVANHIDFAQHGEKFKKILQQLTEVNFMSTDEKNEMLEVVDKNVRWRKKNLSRVEKWLDEKLKSV